MKFALRGDIMFRRWPPRGGWRYVETATGWVAPSPMSDGFRETVKRILAHRTANAGYQLSTDPSAIEADLMDQTAKRILNETPSLAEEWVVPVDEEAKKKSQFQSFSPVERPSPVAPPVHQSLVDRLLARVRGIARGAATLADWLGDGCVPVSPFLAETRASICAGCPLNVKADAVGEFTGAVAEAIRDQTIAKNAVGLSTALEDKLDTCDACGCHLRLKVWVPIRTIRAHMPDEDKERLHGSCWIRHETEVGVARGGRRRAMERTITIRREAAFGDVILATILATKLREVGVASNFITSLVIAEALKGHPDIESFVTGGTPDVDLDRTYEHNLERKTKDIALLFLEAAQHPLKQLGIALNDHANRVPVLGLTDAEKWDVAKSLQKYPRPWIVVVDGSGSWPNRTWSPHDLAKLPGLMPGATLIWSKPRKWAKAPGGYCPIEVRNFRHLMAIVSQCDLVISPDTAPMHVAAAFNKPVIALEQCNDTRLRLTDFTDYTPVAPQLECIRCGEFTCPINATTPPCQAIDAGTVAAMAKQKLAAYSGEGVSVVIPVLNYNDRLLRCIDAIRPQVAEVVVVCDGSSGVPSSVRDRMVRVVASTGTRLGYGASIMRAAHRTTGRWMLMLNDDCYMDPGSVQKMLSVAGLGVGVVGCKLRYPNGRIQHAGQGRGVGIVGFGHIDWNQFEGRIKEPMDVESVTFAAALVRREMFFGVRGFDGRYDCYSEDTDLCLKSITGGWRVVYTPHATGIHDESQSTSPMKEKLLASGNEVFRAKWGDYLRTTKPIICTS